MGMNRHDAYYEPEDDYIDSDELQSEVADLMKTDEFNPHKWNNFCEAFAAHQNKDDIEALEEMLEKRDFEALGRKLWNMSFEYYENWATSRVTGEY